MADTQGKRLAALAAAMRAAQNNRNASSLLNHDNYNRMTTGPANVLTTRNTTTRKVTTSPGSRTSGNGGGDGGAAAALAAANAAARSSAQRQNENTRAAADAKHSLLASFGTARDTKLKNIQTSLQQSDLTLLDNYRTSLLGLDDTRRDNEMAESDSSYANILNAMRERSDIMTEVASQGAGETDILRASLQALRNFDSNQNDINRSFFDTQTSVNRAVTGLNTETVTSRKNLYDRAEDDRESAWANYYNQVADTWTEILNIENSNANIDSDTSVAYNKQYGGAAQEAAKAAASSYQKAAFDQALTKWDSQGEAKERQLASNKAQVVNLGGPMKRPEGATLRRW